MEVWSGIHMSVQPVISQCQNNNEFVWDDGTSDAVFSEGGQKTRSFDKVRRKGNFTGAQ